MSAKFPTLYLNTIDINQFKR